MLDYELVDIFTPIIEDGLSDLNITAEVLQNYQPTKQGIHDSTVYFFNIGDKNIGHLERLNFWDNDAQQMLSKESQTKETTFQVNTILTQDPSNLTITAKDLATYVNLILQRRTTLDVLKSNGIGMLWIGEIRNTPFTFGDDNYTFNPSFDFTITHKQTIIGEVHTIDTFNENIKRI